MNELAPKPRKVRSVTYGCYEALSSLSGSATVAQVYKMMPAAMHPQANKTPTRKQVYAALTQGILYGYFVCHGRGRGRRYLIAPLSHWESRKYYRDGEHSKPVTNGRDGDVTTEPADMKERAVTKAEIKNLSDAVVREEARAREIREQLMAANAEERLKPARLYSLPTLLMAAIAAAQIGFIIGWLI